MPDSSILFYLDENQPVHLLSRILTSRGHQVRPVQVGEKDPSILRSADEDGAVIVTADKWFARELYRFPSGHHQRYFRAGVIQVRGVWTIDGPNLALWLPVVETVLAVRRSQEDYRMAIELRPTTVVVFGPTGDKPSPKT